MCHKNHHMLEQTHIPTWHPCFSREFVRRHHPLYFMKLIIEEILADTLSSNIIFILIIIHLFQICLLFWYQNRNIPCVVLVVLTELCMFDSTCKLLREEWLFTEESSHFAHFLSLPHSNPFQATQLPAANQKENVLIGLQLLFLSMYAPAPHVQGLRWRSLEWKLRSCLREAEGRGAEVWGGGSGARGARGQAVAAKGRRAAPFSKKKNQLPPLKGFEDHGSPRWDWQKGHLTSHVLCVKSLRWNLVT